MATESIRAVDLASAFSCKRAWEAADGYEYAGRASGSNWGAGFFASRVPFGAIPNGAAVCPGAT